MKTDIDISGILKEEIRWYIKQARKKNLKRFTRKYPITCRPKYGLDAASAYYMSLKNQIVPTRHPLLLAAILAEAELTAQNVRTWGSDLAHGSANWHDFETHAKVNNWPEWLKLDVHCQKRHIAGDV